MSTATPLPKPAASLRRKILRVSLTGVALLLVAGGIAWQYRLLPGTQPQPRENSINQIRPYRVDGAWVFDEPSVGLVKEPFVAGVPEMIDILVADIPNAADGFRLTFSAQPFPGHQKHLRRLRGDSGGNYYALDDPPLEGWICPALFKFYKEAPPDLYVRADAIPQE